MTDSPVSRWAENDAAHAIHRADRDAVVATEPARALVLELSTGGPRDYFNACARLGGLLAAHGASPSLAANTIDGAIRALADVGITLDPARVAGARASLVEGYVAGARDAERTEAAARWDYPACAVPLADGTVAIACGHPLDDAEALIAWAGRVVGQLAKARVRRIVLAGPVAAAAEIVSAAELVGIEVASAPAAGRGRSWLRLPWRK